MARQGVFETGSPPGPSSGGSAANVGQLAGKVALGMLALGEIVMLVVFLLD